MHTHPGLKNVFSEVSIYFTSSKWQEVASISARNTLQHQGQAALM